MSRDQEPLLELRGIIKRYALQSTSLLTRSHTATLACDDVSLDVLPAEIVSLVGESGSGKSTLGRIALLLERPDSGSVIFEGVDLTTLKNSDLRRRRRDFQIMFQDSLSALNPRWRVGRSVSHPLRVHTPISGAELTTAVSELLELVELPPSFARRFPHELSGGQRQRVCIARALALRPKLVVADEPLTGLDVSIQAQILRLIETINQEFSTAFLFISHDLRVVRHISSRVAVMNAGKIVEFRKAEELFDAPRHPYTQKLLGSVLRRRFSVTASVDSVAAAAEAAGVELEAKEGIS